MEKLADLSYIFKYNRFPLRPPLSGQLLMMCIIELLTVGFLALQLNGSQYGSGTGHKINIIIWGALSGFTLIIIFRLIKSLSFKRVSTKFTEKDLDKRLNNFFKKKGIKLNQLKPNCYYIQGHTMSNSEKQKIVFFILKDKDILVNEFLTSKSFLNISSLGTTAIRDHWVRDLEEFFN